MSKGHSIQSLDESLQRLLKQLGIEHKVNQYRIIEQWPVFVGERIAQVTRAEQMREGVLFVRVRGMSWRTELTFQKHLILEKIQQKYGNKIITDIRFY